MKKAILKAMIPVSVIVWSLFLAVGVFGAEQNFRVETSPDGEMWTIVQELPGEAGQYWYDSGESYKTGTASALPKLKQGEHYYRYTRTGVIPVGEWKVEFPRAFCVAPRTNEEDVGHGITYGNKVSCELAYFSGWKAYCADCGDPILPVNINASLEAVTTITHINADMGYYYICPCNKPIYQEIVYEDAYDDNGNLILRPVEYEIVGYEICGHLEKYWEAEPHICKAVSANRYQVVYDANGSGASGVMEPSFHMYNNAEVYEGQTVTPVKNLSLCTYDRSAEGYVFLGWNTKPDGSGTFYADGAEIYNLTVEGTVTLYAQWKAVSSVLVIDANGGSYQGNSRITKSFEAAEELDASKLTPPAGYTVTFQSNGGSMDAAIITGTCTFYRWELQQPAYGELKGDTYYFTGPDQSIDTVKAIYSRETIILPDATKKDYSLGGWYLDSACKQLAGNAGEEYLPSQNTVLYAKWVDLKLTARPDYSADVNGGKGAVNLYWSQKDGTKKSYILYRKEEQSGQFEEVVLAEDESNAYLLDETYGYEGQTKHITIPSSGFYALTAEGASGGDYGSYSGGLGGRVSGTFYLSKGEVISFTVGGSDGYNGGGAAADYGNGGGFTIVSSDRKGTLLVAGGGGGATSSQNGLPGGSEEGLLIESGSQGESGMAGGGGGFRGGAAGTRIEHIHSVEAGCYLDASSDARKDVVYTEGSWEESAEDEDGTDIYLYRYIYQQAGSIDHLIPVEGNTTLDIGAWVYASGHNILRDNSRVEVRNQDGDIIYAYSLGRLRQDWTDYFGADWSVLAGSLYTDNVVRYNPPSVSTVHIYSEWEQSDTGGGAYDILTGYKVYYPTFYDDNGDGSPESFQLSKIALDSEYQNPAYYGSKYNGYYYPKVEIPDSDIMSQVGFRDSSLLFTERSFWYGRSGAYFNKTISIPEGTTGIYLYVEGSLDAVQNGEVRPSEDYHAYFDKIYLSGGLKLDCDAEDTNTPAYGGSNYINIDYGVVAENLADVKEGNGSVAIKAQLVGLVEAASAEHVAAPDKAAPDKVDVDSIVRESAGENVAAFCFDAVQDQGTNYYFKAESYSTTTGDLVCESNIAECLIKTGVRGYYYLVDQNSGTSVTAFNAQNKGNPVGDAARRIEVQVKETVQYLHIAAVDYAGNVSGTVHIKIDSKEIPVAWKVSTDDVNISSVVGNRDYENVYTAEKERSFYVKADGTTPFLLSFYSYMHGIAREDYQINYQIFDALVEGTNDAQTQRYGTILPYTLPLSSAEPLDATAFSKWMEGTLVLSDASYMGAIRTNTSRDVSFYRAFTMPETMNGKTVVITPAAGAAFEKTVQYSDRGEDSAHAIKLIGDGDAPVICGLDQLADLQVLDKEQGSILLELSAEDALSGVKEFYVVIQNADNFLKKSFTAGEDGVIRVNITEEETLFSGDFTVTVYASDQVGNETSVSYMVTEYALVTGIYRMLSPHTPDFKRGESGFLTIETWGYVDKVEVEFPEFLSAYNQVYTYEVPQYKEDETIQFMIPLDAPGDGSFEVIVRAYKGENVLEDTLMLSVEGSVLDELRTRLR